MNNANSPDLDKVEVASDESFPASDPPAWGSSHAAPSESTVCADLQGEAKRNYVLYFAAGALAVGAAVGIGFAIRHLRR